MIVNEKTVTNRVDYDLLDIDDDQIYYYEEQPFNGVAYELWEDGSVRTETEFVNGIQNGWSREWYKNGQLKDEIHLKNAAGHGISRKWYENRQIKTEEQIEHGICLNSKEWDMNGALIKDYELSKIDPYFDILESRRQRVNL